MNKKNLYIAALFLMLSAISFAQPKRVMVVQSAPTFTLQANINYNQSYLEFNGTYNNDFHSNDYIKGEALGADKGLGGTITAKIPLTEKGRLRLNLSLNYNNFLTYLFGKNNLVADVGKSSFNVFSFGAGLEHNFTPNYKYKIYLGAEGTFNMIGGNTHLWHYVAGGTNYEDDVTITNSFRIGAALFGGAEYLLNPKLGLSLGFKYNVANILLKDAKASDDPYKFPLRDKFDANIPFSGNKTLAYISLMAGVNFYWGIQSTRYTIK